MTADELKTITTSALETLAAALDAGHSEQLTAMLRAVARFHRYSVHNVWLIAAQCPTATRVAGFQTWKTLGRFVRRGEKGIAILAPIVRRQRTHATDEPERGVVGFRAAYVFDVAQTDGEALPELAATLGDPGLALDHLRASIALDGIQVSYAESLGGPLGLSKGRAIELVVGLDAATEFVVLAHEYAHELLHRGDDRPASRDTRELEAEAVAYVVSEAMGLAALDSARDYIHLYHGDRESLVQSLERIQRTAARIVAALGGT
jgi:hypothetical protein